MTDFAATINVAYATEGAAIDLGRGVHDGELVREAEVKIPLATMNRHGLVAGATGTGKTKTLQVITEQLSRAGVPVLVADVKGDVSGVAVPAEAGGAGEKRMADLGLPFTPEAFPVQFLSLGGIGPGVPVRATVTDFGPQLLGKVLSANQTQEQSLGLVFHYGERLDNRSAREILADRLAKPEPLPPTDAEAPMEHVPVPKRSRKAPKERASDGGGIGDFLRSRQGKQMQREVIRGVFGMLRKRL